MTQNVTNKNNLFFFDNAWFDENPKIIGPDTHAFWMSSVVFDGARAFNGLVPDLDLHCNRLVRSAKIMGLEPSLNGQKVFERCCEGLRKLPASEYYIRPAFYAEEGFVTADPQTTQFVLSILEMPLPRFTGFSACVSSFRRPSRDMAPTDAKASCLYPNSARALREAHLKGFDNAILKDANGNVTELATANLWIVKDGTAVTPAANGTFLAGITRNRILSLLRNAHINVEERVVSLHEVLEAEEAFSTGNYGKVLPITSIESHALKTGPVASRAYELYM